MLKACLCCIGRQSVLVPGRICEHLTHRVEVVKAGNSRRIVPVPLAELVPVINRNHFLRKALLPRHILVAQPVHNLQLRRLIVPADAVIYAPRAVVPAHTGRRDYVDYPGRALRLKLRLLPGCGVGFCGVAENRVRTDIFVLLMLLRRARVRLEQQIHAVKALLAAGAVEIAHCLAHCVERAEILHQLRQPVHRHHRLIVDNEIARIFEIPLNPVGDEVFLPVLHSRNARCIVILPHQHEFQLVAVLAFHKSVVQRPALHRSLHRHIHAALAEPAEHLVVDAMLGEPLDFPVGNLGAALVIKADERCTFLVAINKIPAHLCALTPKAARLHTEYVVAVFLGDYRLGDVIRRLGRNFADLDFVNIALAGRCLADGEFNIICPAADFDSLRQKLLIQINLSPAALGHEHNIVPEPGFERIKPDKAAVRAVAERRSVRAHADNFRPARRERRAEILCCRVGKEQILGLERIAGIADVLRDAALARVARIIEFQPVHIAADRDVFARHRRARAYHRPVVGHGFMRAEEPLVHDKAGVDVKVLKLKATDLRVGGHRHKSVEVFHLVFKWRIAHEGFAV